MFERLKSHGVNLVALGFAFILIVAYFIRHDVGAISSRHWLWIFSLMMSFFASIFNYWRQLKITEAPISTIAAAAQGYVELYGKAKTDKPFQEGSYQKVWGTAFFLLGVTSVRSFGEKKAGVGSATIPILKLKSMSNSY